MVDCKVCGEQCRHIGSALYSDGWECLECGVRYYDRSDINTEVTSMGGDNRLCKKYLVWDDDKENLVFNKQSYIERWH